MKSLSEFQNQTGFLVLSAISWNSLEILDVPLSKKGPNGSVAFMMVFKTREEAIAFNEGSEENIQEIRFGVYS